MKNNSKVPIEFRVTLDSEKETSRREAELKRLANLNKSNFKSPIGPNNYFGSTSFDVHPVHGSIAPGSKVDLKISFRPDHTSEFYSDTMRIIMVSNEKNSRVISLGGKSRSNNMYVRGVECLSGNLSSESMILVDLDETSLMGGEEKPEETTTKKGNKGDKGDKGEKLKSEICLPQPILVTLYAMPSSKANGEFTQAERVIFIGCMRSTSEKKDFKKVD